MEQEILLYGDDRVVYEERQACRTSYTGGQNNGDRRHQEMSSVRLKSEWQ